MVNVLWFPTMSAISICQYSFKKPLLVHNTGPGKEPHFKGNLEHPKWPALFPASYVYHWDSAEHSYSLTGHCQVIQVVPGSTWLKQKMRQIKPATECLGQTVEACYNLASLTVIRQILARLGWIWPVMPKTKTKNHISEAIPKAKLSFVLSMSHVWAKFLLFGFQSCSWESSDFHSTFS